MAINIIPNTVRRLTQYFEQDVVFFSGTLFLDIYLFLFDRYTCPHIIIIVGWWCSSPLTEATGTLDYIPFILYTNVPQPQ